MIQAHKLTGIPFHPSPNVGGVMSSSPSAVVIHYTGNSSLSSAVQWLRSTQARASAHVVIGEDGDMVQLVPFNQIAWHAGKSHYQGRSNFNRFAIGIELVNPGRLTPVGEDYCAWFGDAYPKERVIKVSPSAGQEESCWCAYTGAQSAAVQQLLLVLKSHYPIDLLVGHDEISPGRKQDPGPAFPMQALRRQVLDINRHSHCAGQDKPAPLTGEVTASKLNIRSAIEGAARSGPLLRGQAVTVLEEYAGWYKVQVQEIGWVKKEYVAVREPQSPAPGHG